jgi:Phage Terminase
VVVKRDADNVFHALWRVWQPDKRHEVQLADVEQFVADLAGHFTVEAVVFDPRYFIQASQNLEDQGIPMVEWVHRRMPSAVNTLREIIANRRLRHGADRIARQHALAAETVEREYGEIIRKRKTREPNDALVSLAMACEWAASLKPPRGSVYESDSRSWPRELVERHHERATSSAVGRGRRAPRLRLRGPPAGRPYRPAAPATQP